MARPSDEFDVAWSSLSGTGDRHGWQFIPIAPAGKCRLAAGRRAPGNEEALMAAFPAAAIPSAEKLPEGQGFNIERVDLHEVGTTWLALSRKDSGDFGLFSSMVCDVTGALDAEGNTDELRLLRVFLGRVRAWQEFMRKGAQALGHEEEIGLVGELMLLAAIIKAGVPAATAIESWVGPLDSPQDFEIGTGSLEVKATLSAQGFPSKIGSLEQLDDSVRQPLFIAGARLRQIASGQNLPDHVDAMRHAIKGDAEAGRLLSERLVAAGYFDADADRYPRRFVSAGTRIVEVAGDFPRLTHGRVPEGIMRAKYEIDLDKTPGADVGIEQALKKLGAI